MHKKNTWNKFEIDVNLFKKLYYTKGLTQQDISNKFGVGRDTIINFMKRHNIDAKNTRFKVGHDAWNEGLTKKIDSRIDYKRPTKFKKGNQMWKLRK